MVFQVDDGDSLSAGRKQRENVKYCAGPSILGLSLQWCLECTDSSKLLGQ